MNEIPEQTFTASFFIRYFSNIPDDQWCVGTIDDGDGRHCGLGHCGSGVRAGVAHFTTMAIALDNLISQYTGGFGAAAVNDCRIPRLQERFPQKCPKERILAVLHEIQSKQTPPKPAPVVHECCHIWLACGVCMLCSATAQPATVREVV